MSKRIKINRIYSHAKRSYEIRKFVICIRSKIEEKRNEHDADQGE
jgi:hypothetical protein